jgi:hypothetical protein
MIKEIIEYCDFVACCSNGVLSGNAMKPFEIQQDLDLFENVFGHNEGATGFFCRHNVSFARQYLDTVL